MLTRFFAILGLTALYLFFLQGAFWGLGFTIVNLGLVFTILSFYPKVLSSKESLFYLAASAILSLFIPFRTFLPGFILTIPSCLILNSLAVSRLGAQNPLSLKALVLAPLILILGTLTEILEWVRRLAKNSRLVVNGEHPLKINVGVLLTGLILAVPLLVIFTLLFVSADPLFGKLVTDLLKSLRIDFTFLNKTLEAVVVFGVLSSIINSPKSDKDEFPVFNEVMHYQKEIAVAAVLLIILIALFLGVQAQYLMLTEEALKQMGVMLSEYTRRGYAELLIVSAISLAVVSALVKRKEERATAIKVVAAIFLIEVLLLLLSATRRNYLYTSAHGFSQIRLIGAHLSLWLLGVLGLFFSRVLGYFKDKSLFFALVALSIVVLSVLQFVNVDYLVGKVNKPNLGYGVDYRYITRSLSTDAWPGWADTIDYLEQTNDCRFREEYQASLGLVDNYLFLKERSKDNWHNLGSWTLPDSQALDYLEDNKPRVDALINKFKTCLKI